VQNDLDVNLSFLAKSSLSEAGKNMSANANDTMQINMPSHVINEQAWGAMPVALHRQLSAFRHYRANIQRPK
jgi:hypothetical protein